jgi:hypothetical protein
LTEESIVYLLSTWIETVQTLHGQERARTGPEHACEAEARVARFGRWELPGNTPLRLTVCTGPAAHAIATRGITNHALRSSCWAADKVIGPGCRF